MTFQVSRIIFGIYFVEVTAFTIGQHRVRGAPYKSDAISKWHIIMIRFIFTSVLTRSRFKAGEDRLSSPNFFKKLLYSLNLQIAYTVAQCIGEASKIAFSPDCFDSTSQQLRLFLPR